MKYEHILWCKEGTHDKVWGIIELGIVNSPNHWGWNVEKFRYATFWGRRGNALQTKVWEGHPYEASKERDKKIKKGYKIVDPIEMDTLYPEFEQDLEKTAVWAMLGV